MKLHREVAAKAEADIDFSMTIDKACALGRWLKACFRPHIVFFYGPIIAVDVVGIFMIRSK